MMNFKNFLFCSALMIGSIWGETLKNQEEDLYNKDIPSFFINAEFLYWTVSEGALDYALTMNNSASGDTVYASGDYKLAKFDWDPGFRISLGYFNALKYYNVYGEYTRITIDNSNSSNKPDVVDHYLTGTFPQIISILTHAESSIKMNHDLVNLLASRVFIPNPHLRLYLLGGPSMIITKQKWNVKYYSSSNQTDVKNKWKYFGGGVRLGLNLDWFAGRHFYITAKSSTGLYLGKYKNYSIQKTNVNGYNENVPFKDSKYDHCRPVFSVQFLLGPSWQKSFSSNRVEIFAGYEMNGWLNLHEIYRSSSGTASTNKDTYINKEFLAMHGLTTRFSINF